MSGFLCNGTVLGGRALPPCRTRKHAGLAVDEEVATDEAAREVRGPCPRRARASSSRLGRT
jgi:hypothetical protein